MNLSHGLDSCLNVTHQSLKVIPVAKRLIRPGRFQVVDVTEPVAKCRLERLHRLVGVCSRHRISFCRRRRLIPMAELGATTEKPGRFQGFLESIGLDAEVFPDGPGCLAMVLAIE